MRDMLHHEGMLNSGCGDEGNHQGFIDKELLKHRTILVSSVVDRDLMENVVSRAILLEAEDPKGAITVYVNSPGGDADSGFAIYDTLKFVSCPVHAICAGLCASAGVIIFLGGDKGKRVSFPHSRFLIHQPSLTTQGQASDIEITAKQGLKVRDRYNSIVSDETGVSEKKVRKDANRDFWLSAEEALEYTLIDKIVSSSSEID